MIIPVAVIYVIAMFALFVAVAASWVSRRKDIRDCSRFALAVVGVYSLLLILPTFGAEDLMWVRAFVLPVDIVRTFLFTAIGVSCCVAAGIVAFPLLRPELGSQGTTVRRSLVAPVSISLLLAGTWIAYTVLLFNVAEPELTDVARRLFGESGVSDSMATVILAVSACAFGEELIFRLGIQHYIARLFGWWDRRYWLAILLSATLWSLGHVGTLEPGWVKLAQVFPAGLALGWLARKHGIETCILAHLVFNLAACWMAEAGLL